MQPAMHIHHHHHRHHRQGHAQCLHFIIVIRYCALALATVQRATNSTSPLEPMGALARIHRGSWSILT
jgi:hypothetical protein